MTSESQLVLGTSKLGTKLLHLKTDALLSDVTLLCDTVTIKAHKCILSASSVVFKGYFTGPDGSDIDTLDLSKRTKFADYIDNVVKFMYSGCVNLNLTNFAGIVGLASDLQCGDLVDLCWKYLDGALNERTCLPLYLKFRELRLEGTEKGDPLDCIRLRLWNMVEKDFYGRIVLQDQILEVSPEVMIYLLSEVSSKKLKTNNVLQLATRWLHLHQDPSAGQVVEFITNSLVKNFQSQPYRSKRGIVYASSFLEEIKKSQIEDTQKASIISKLEEFLTKLEECLGKEQQNLNSEQSAGSESKIVREKRKKKENEDDDIENSMDNETEGSDKGTHDNLECKICKKKFVNQVELSCHVISHKDVRVHVCDQCPKRFKHPQNLRAHMVLKHQSGEKVTRPSVCHHCGKVLKNRSCLHRHLLTHLEDRPYKCLQCPKAYTKSTGLEVHMRLHTGEKPFQCEICSKLFTIKCNLDRHIQRHLGEKPYKCDQCDKAFLQKTDLIRHETVHTGEKKFQCRYCGKLLALKRSVPVHERIHTGEKPYECKTCGKCFSTSSYLRRHNKTHLKDKPTPRVRQSVVENVIMDNINRNDRNGVSIMNFVENPPNIDRMSFQPLPLSRSDMPPPPPNPGQYMPPFSSGIGYY